MVFDAKSTRGNGCDGPALIDRYGRRRRLLSKLGVPLVWAFERGEIEAVALENGSVPTDRARADRRHEVRRLSCMLGQYCLSRLKVVDVEVGQVVDIGSSAECDDGRRRGGRRDRRSRSAVGDINSSSCSAVAEQAYEPRADGPFQIGDQPVVVADAQRCARLVHRSAHVLDADDLEVEVKVAGTNADGPEQAFEVLGLVHIPCAAARSPRASARRALARAG